MSDTELLTQTTCPLEQLQDTYIKLMDCGDKVEVDYQGSLGDLAGLLATAMYNNEEFKSVIGTSLLMLRTKLVEESKK